MGQRQTASTVLAGACAIVSAVFLWTWGPDTALPEAAHTRASDVSLSRVKIPGKALSAPVAIAANGNRVWVANSRYPMTGSAGGWVTELSAKTGALIRVISAQRYQLNDPGAVTADGNRVWVADAGNGSITEINATTGALIQVITSLPKFSFAAASGGAGVWFVTNAGVKGVGDSGPEGSVAEIGATSGQLIPNISGAPFATSNPGGAITASGTHVWVAGTNYYRAQGWVAELSTATGALSRIISG